MFREITKAKEDKYHIISSAGELIEVKNIVMVSQSSEKKTGGTGKGP